jgi:chemotaxis-related protein WspB
MPGAPGWVRGVFMHRSDLIPLIDADGLIRSIGGLHEPASTDRMRNRVLALRLSATPERPEWRVGLWVDCLLELERIDFTGAGTHPGFATEHARFLGPVAQTRFGFVQLVKPDDLLTPQQAGVLTRQVSEAFL